MVCGAELQRKDERDSTYALMLYYSLYGDKISRVGVRSIEEALGRMSRYPEFLSELAELTDYLLSALDTPTFAVGEGMPAALEQYGCYTREEVFAIFGRQTADKKMQGSVAGVAKEVRSSAVRLSSDSLLRMIRLKCSASMSGDSALSISSFLHTIPSSEAACMSCLNP